MIPGDTEGSWGSTCGRPLRLKEQVDRRCGRYPGTRGPRVNEGVGVCPAGALHPCHAQFPGLWQFSPSIGCLTWDSGLQIGVVSSWEVSFHQRKGMGKYWSYLKQKGPGLVTESTASCLLVTCNCVAYGTNWAWLRSAGQQGGKKQLPLWEGQGVGTGMLLGIKLPTPL